MFRSGDLVPIKSPHPTEEMEEDERQAVIMTVIQPGTKEKSKRKTRKRRKQKQQGGGFVIDEWLSMVTKTETFSRHQPRDNYNILNSLNQDLLTNGNLKISYMNIPDASETGNDFGIRDPNNFVSPTSLYDIAATVHCLIKDLLNEAGATTKGFVDKITEMDTPERGFADVISYLNDVENAIRGPNSNPVSIKNMDNYPLYIWALAAFVGNVDCVTLKPMLFTKTDEQKMVKPEGMQQSAIPQMQEPYPTG